MASSIHLYQPTNTLFSKTQVPISFLFSHPFCVSSICTSDQHCFLSEQFKGSRRGFLWKPSYSFGSRAENRARPIRASVGAPPFPLFQPPQVEETTSSEVNSTFLVFFLFVPRLFACWLLFWWFGSNWHLGAVRVSAVSIIWCGFMFTTLRPCLDEFLHKYLEGKKNWILFP